MSNPPSDRPMPLERWNGETGRTWVDLQDVLDPLMAPVAEAVVAKAFPGPGGRVLDVGCGAGATSLMMARALGEGGHCLGVDISEALVEAAARRSREEGLAATFAVGDAQTYPFEPAGFDAAISRFGVMFFEDPVAAFANIRRAVRPEGRLVFAAWRSREENPFMTTALRAAAEFLPDLSAPDPEAPGQFAFASEARMRRILSGAGWREIEAAPLDAPATLPRADLARYVTRMGPVGLALPALAEPQRRQVSDAVVRAFDPFVRGNAAVFDMACWLVTARP